MCWFRNELAKCCHVTNVSHPYKIMLWKQIYLTYFVNYLFRDIRHIKNESELFHILTIILDFLVDTASDRKSTVAPYSRDPRPFQGERNSERH